MSTKETHTVLASDGKYDIVEKAGTKYIRTNPEWIRNHPHWMAPGYNRYLAQNMNDPVLAKGRYSLIETPEVQFHHNAFLIDAGAVNKISRELAHELVNNLGFKAVIGPQLAEDLVAIAKWQPAPVTSPAQPSPDDHEGKVVLMVAECRPETHGDEPYYVEFAVTTDLVERIERLLRACYQAQLNEARINMAPHFWGTEMEMPIQLTNDQLAVTSYGALYYSAEVASYRGIINSRPVPINEIRSAFESASDGDVVFLTTNQIVHDRYAMDHESAPDAQHPMRQG